MTLNENILRNPIVTNLFNDRHTDDCVDGMAMSEFADWINMAYSYRGGRTDACRYQISPERITVYLDSMIEYVEIKRDMLTYIYRWNTEEKAYRFCEEDDVVDTFPKSIYRCKIDLNYLSISMRDGGELKFSDCVKLLDLLISSPSIESPIYLKRRDGDK